MKKLMLGLMIAFASNVAMAEMISKVMIDGFGYTLDTESETATIIGYTGTPTKIDVGEVEWDGRKYAVTMIGRMAFSGCSSLTEISLSNATTIGSSAFSDCPLSSVSLPSATTIGGSAFRNCPLTSVLLPNVISIEQAAFYGCKTLTSVSLPSATTIGIGAFEACDLLKSISLPKATTFGQQALSKCSSLTSVSFPNALLIGDLVFGNCDLLTSVSLPSATTIGKNAFYGCKMLASVSLPSATTIGQYAFYVFQGTSLSVLFVNAEMKSGIEKNGRSYYSIPENATIIDVFLPKDVVENARYETLLKSGDTVLDEDFYKSSCLVWGLAPKEKPQVIQNDEIVVKKESIAAPSAGTVKVEDNKVQLGVTVLKTSDLTAEKKEWGEVTLTADDVKVVDGKIVISVPVDSASGFMVIQTKDAAK